MELCTIKATFHKQTPAGDEDQHLAGKDECLQELHSEIYLKNIISFTAVVNTHAFTLARFPIPPPSPPPFCISLSLSLSLSLLHESQHTLSHSFLFLPLPLSSFLSIPLFLFFSNNTSAKMLRKYLPLI